MTFDPKATVADEELFKTMPKEYQEAVRRLYEAGVLDKYFSPGRHVKYQEYSRFV